MCEPGPRRRVLDARFIPPPTLARPPPLPLQSSLFSLGFGGWRVQAIDLTPDIDDYEMLGEICR